MCSVLERSHHSEMPNDNHRIFQLHQRLQSTKTVGEPKSELEFESTQRQLQLDMAKKEPEEARFRLTEGATETLTELILERSG